MSENENSRPRKGSYQGILSPPMLFVEESQKKLLKNEENNCKEEEKEKLMKSEVNNEKNLEVSQVTANSIMKK